MQIAQIQFAPWDEIYNFKPETETGHHLDLKEGDLAVVNTQLGQDLGKVIFVGELYDDQSDSTQQIKPVLRKADAGDLATSIELSRAAKSQLKDCHEVIKEMNLPMKLVDLHASLDGQRLTFAFVADGRVDFRELVKTLANKYQKSIRMRQIGVRDEAKLKGDLGACGRQLCCQTFLEDLGNVTTDMAKDQQVSHRGSERLSGPCGRLKCCLRYEESTYKSLMGEFPALGSKVKVRQGNGLVVGWHAIKGTIEVQLSEGEDQGRVVEVEYKN